MVVPLAFYPTSKTLWSAIDLAMRPLEPDDDVDPRYIPGSRHREGLTAAAPSPARALSVTDQAGLPPGGRGR